MRGEFTSFIHRITSSHCTFYKRIGVKRNSVRLACVKHAASVRPEPGSNSPINLLLESLNGSIIIFSLKEIVFGAENEIRTRDPRLGKAMLYH